MPYAVGIVHQLHRRKWIRPESSPATTVAPSGVTAHVLNSPSPVNAMTVRPLARSQTLSVASSEVDAASRAPGNRATDVTNA